MVDKSDAYKPLGQVAYLNNARRALFDDTRARCRRGLPKSEIRIRHDESDYDLIVAELWDTARQLLQDLANQQNTKSSLKAARNAFGRVALAADQMSNAMETPDLSLRRELMIALADVDRAMLGTMQIVAKISDSVLGHAIERMISVIKRMDWLNFESSVAVDEISAACKATLAYLDQHAGMPDPNVGGRGNYMQILSGPAELRFAWRCFWIFDRVRPGAATRTKNGPFARFIANLFRFATGKQLSPGQVERMIRNVENRWKPIESRLRLERKINENQMWDGHQWQSYLHLADD